MAAGGGKKGKKKTIAAASALRLPSFCSYGCGGVKSSMSRSGRANFAGFRQNFIFFFFLSKCVALLADCSMVLVTLTLALPNGSIVPLQIDSDTSFADLGALVQVESSIAPDQQVRRRGV
jgi:hypothetical protein